jgi:hypothetical protein
MSGQSPSNQPANRGQNGDPPQRSMAARTMLPRDRRGGRASVASASHSGSSLRRLRASWPRSLCASTATSPPRVAWLHHASSCSAGADHAVTAYVLAPDRP